MIQIIYKINDRPNFPCISFNWIHSSLETYNYPSYSFFQRWARSMLLLVSAELNYGYILVSWRAFIVIRTQGFLNHFLLNKLHSEGPLKPTKTLLLFKKSYNLVCIFVQPNRQEDAGIYIATSDIFKLHWCKSSAIRMEICERYS